MMSEHVTTDEGSVLAGGLPYLPYPPRLTASTEPFWSGLVEGEFRTTKCRACQHISFPPKPICPACWSRDVEWVAMSGRGILASFTEVSAAPKVFAAETPYVLALVDLEEGVRCLSRILAPYDDLRVGIPVRLKIRPAQPLYLFDFVPDMNRDVLGGTKDD